MDLDDLLRDLSDDGSSAGKGAFTLAPEKAREKLAQSVPPGLSSPWVAACLTRQALRLWHDTYTVEYPVPPDLEEGGERVQVDYAREMSLTSNQASLKLMCRLPSRLAHPEQA